MRNSVLTTAVLLLIAIFILGCSGSDAPPAASGDIAAGGGDQPGAGIAVALPSPSQLRPLLARNRMATYTENDLARAGADFASALPHAGVSPVGTELGFDPSWPLGGVGTLANLAYAIFSFNLTGYDRTCQVQYSWSLPPSHPGSTWLALANWEADRWDWYRGNISGLVNVQTATPPLKQYINDTSDLLLVVLRMGTDGSTLAGVKLGTQLPVALLQSAKPAGFAPCEVTFDPSGSYDPDGAIRYFEYDFEGDGIVDLRQTDPATVKHTYTQPGTYNATLVITDGEGGTARSCLSVGAAAPWVHSLGCGREEYFYAVATDPAGHVYGVGSTTSDLNEINGLLIAKFTPAGELLWAKIWGEEPVWGTFGRSIAVAPNGDLIVAGLTCRFAYDVCDDGLQQPDYLVQRWTADGELLWSRTWGDSWTEAATSVAVNPAGIFVLGTNTTFGVGHDMVLLSYDYEGNLRWAYAWGDYLAPQAGEGQVVSTPDGDGYRLTCVGNLFKFQTIEQEIATLEFTDGGAFISAHTWGENLLHETAQGICVDQDGNKYIVGTYYRCDEQNRNMFPILMLAADPDWNCLWQKKVSGYVEQVGTAVIQDSPETITFAGHTTGHSLVLSSYLLRLTRSGALVSSHQYLDPAVAPAFYGLAAYPDGGLLVGGAHTSATATELTGGGLSLSSPAGAWRDSAMVPREVAAVEGAPVAEPTDVTDQWVLDSGGGGTDGLLMLLKR